MTTPVAPTGIVFPRWVTQLSAVFFGIASVLQILQAVLDFSILPPWVAPTVIAASAICGFLGKGLGDADHDGVPDLFQLEWWQTTGKALLDTALKVVRGRGTPPSAPMTIASDHTPTDGDT